MLIGRLRALRTFSSFSLYLPATLCLHSRTKFVPLLTLLQLAYFVPCLTTRSFSFVFSRPLSFASPCVHLSTSNLVVSQKLINRYRFRILCHNRSSNRTKVCNNLINRTQCRRTFAHLRSVIVSDRNPLVFCFIIYGVLAVLGNYLHRPSLSETFCGNVWVLL